MRRSVEPDARRVAHEYREIGIATHDAPHTVIAAPRVDIFAIGIEPLVGERALSAMPRLNIAAADRRAVIGEIDDCLLYTSRCV